MIDRDFTYEQERPDAEDGHDPDQLRQDRVEGAGLVGAKEVVPPQQGQAEDGARPRVYQEQEKVLQIAQADAVVHPRT